jgi:quercetin dioxygenase-like cupin family protein
VAEKREPMVQRTRRLAGRALTFLLGAEDDTLREFARASKNGRAAKTLVKEGPLRITLVALTQGTSLPPRRVPGPVSIQTLRGCLRVATETTRTDLTTGGLVALQAGVDYSARAVADTAILLTVVMAPR